MYIKCTFKDIPFRTLSFLFLLWNNSSYVTYGKNMGFFCDDESIKKPYYGDTIHITHLLGCLLGGFAVIMYISEVIFQKEFGCLKQYNSRCQFRLIMKYYYSGLLHVVTSTEVIKCFFSELRPHFFYTCLPDMSKIDCSKGLVTYFNCTGQGARWLIDRDIYKSFPSGHAALSAYAFIFISVYFFSKNTICSRHKNLSSLCIWWTRSLGTISFILMVFCCVSRILDNRHFWWDVLIGICIGLFGGFTTINITMKQVVRRLKIL